MKVGARQNLDGGAMARKNSSLQHGCNGETLLLRLSLCHADSQELRRRHPGSQKRQPQKVRNG